jgi:hypothetical protein
VKEPSKHASTYKGEPGYETLLAKPSLRGLVSRNGEYDLSAKLVAAREGDDQVELFVVKFHVADRDAAGANGHQGMWQHEVKDPHDGTTLAVGRDTREGESWKMAKKMLSARGIVPTS